MLQVRCTRRARRSRRSRNAQGRLVPREQLAWLHQEMSRKLARHWQVHQDGAKDEGTILLIMGEGPATSPAEEK